MILTCCEGCVLHCLSGHNSWMWCRSLVLILVIISVLSSQGVSAADNTSEFMACTRYGTKLEDWDQSRLSTLHAAFPVVSVSRDDPLDLIFLIDSSQSIRQTAFNLTKVLIDSLVQYLVAEQRLLIHPDDARLAAITFQDVAITEFAGIDHTRFDACSFEKRLSSIQRVQAGQTQLDKALKSAFSHFDNSERKDIARRVLWVFTDGEYRGEGDDDELKANVQEQIDQLKDIEVQIFTGGVGGGIIGGSLRLREYEDNLESMAHDASHYLCIQHWQELIDSIGISQKADNQTAVVYAPVVNEAQEPSCEECSSVTKRCVCDLISKQYACYDCLENEDDQRRDYICSVTKPSTTTSSPANDEGDDGDDGDDDKLAGWLLYVVIGACVAAALIILLIIILCCICFRRKKKRKEHHGPPLPPPPIPPRGRTHMIMAADPEYGNTLDLKTGRYGPEQPQGRSEVDINLEYDVAACERDMEGWSLHLQQMSQEAGLLHLAVHSVDSRRRWATTPGFRIPSKEVKEMDSAFRQGADFSGGQIKVAGNMYTLDKKNMSDLQMHGKRPRIVGGITREEQVCVAKAGKYVIVGVAESGREDLLQNTVFSLYRHLVDAEEAQPISNGSPFDH